MVRVRLTIPLVVVVIAVVIAGCGDDAGSSSGSSPDLASFALPGSLVYVEADLQPKGELQANVDAVTEIIAGSDSLDDLIVSELESSARDEGQTFDFDEEVRPWLGERGAAAFEKLEEGELSEPLIAIQSKDEAATRAFVDARARQSDEPFQSSSYEGVEFQVGGSEGNAIGVLDGALVIADDEAAFKAAVDAVEGDSLGDEARFADAIASASDGSFADVYADVGGILEQSEDEIDPRAGEALKSSGIDPSEATAVASIIPESEQIEVELSSDLGGEQAPSGDASELLGSMPADSFAAIGFSDFGDQLQEAIDNLDETGIPPDVPPNKLKSTLSQGGVDLDEVAASIEDAAIFAEGDDRDSLGGALVASGDETDEATKAIEQLGILLRGARVPGITAIGSQGAVGFSIRNADLDRPIVVATKGSRIAIGYGLAPALAGLETGSGATLADTASYKAAVASLGKTPISAFADGPAALALADALVPRSESDYREARPYLGKISFLALGSVEQDELATAKLIVGLAK
jgi:uncharacterized protein DUF3352